MVEESTKMSLQKIISPVRDEKTPRFPSRGVFPGFAKIVSKERNKICFVILLKTTENFVRQQDFF